MEGNWTKAFEWYQFQWPPWTTPNPNFKIMPLFNAKYLRNGPRYIYNYNELLSGTAFLKSIILFRTTLSDLEWLNEIFSDTKHRAVSLQQLIFLFEVLQWYAWGAVGSLMIIITDLLLCAGKIILKLWPKVSLLSRVSTLTRDIDIAILSFRLSVCPSVRP